MKKENSVIISIKLSKEAAFALDRLAKKENRTVSQQAEFIIHSFLKDYSRVSALENKKTFGAITEENLRDFLKKEENQKAYRYEDIQHLSFDELFQFWMKTF